MKGIKSPFRRTATEYGVMTLSIWIMVVGICFFKFPNHFTFGGVIDFSTVISEVTRQSAGDFTPIVNMLLLLLGFMFLGKGFGIKTVHASTLMSFTLSLLERVCPLARPLTDEPLLELMSAIFLPAIGAAILFSLGASSGDTDIIAMILKKHTSLGIGMVLMLVGVAAVASSSSVLGPETGLFSTIGLAVKSFAINDVTRNLDLCKCSNIIYDNPESICDYIISTPHRSVTVYHAQGAFSHNEKTVTMTTMERSQALKLRDYIHDIEPITLMLISNSSGIIGKGFLTN